MINVARLFVSSCIVFTMCVLLLPARGSADIGGQTTVTYLKNGTVVKQRVTLGSSVAGSFGEAFIDALQVLDGLRQIIDGIITRNIAEIGGGAVNVYSEARQLAQSTADKMSDDHAWVLVDVDDDNIDTVKITFTVWSGDDPFGFIRSAIPDTPGFSKDGDQFFERGNVRNVRRASRTVTINLRQSVLSESVILFLAKEMDCHQCLAISHTLRVYVRRFGPPPVPYHFHDPVLARLARQLDLEWKTRARTLNDNVWAATAQEASLIAQNRATQNNRRDQRIATGACTRAHGGTFPDAAAAAAAAARLADCEDRADTRHQGLCVDLSYGGDRALCDALRPLVQSIQDGMARIHALNEERDAKYRELVETDRRSNPLLIR